MNSLTRREFVKNSAILASGVSLLSTSDALAAHPAAQVVDDFRRPDSHYHGYHWESLNPGYWKIENHALRRRLTNVGDGARRMGFPYHYESHGRDGQMIGGWQEGYGLDNEIAYDPSLPYGMLWRTDWPLTGNYQLQVTFTIKERMQPPHPNHDWQMYQPGYAVMGVCFGGNTPYESWENRDPERGAWFAGWRDTGHFGMYQHYDDVDEATVQEVATPTLKRGDQVTMEVVVGGNEADQATVAATMRYGKQVMRLELPTVDRARFTEGYFGVVGRGLLDFEVNEVSLTPAENQPQPTEPTELLVAYPLGDTLREEGEAYTCRFVAIFSSDGQEATVRISESERPTEGWDEVPVAGGGDIVTNDFRCNTAVIDVTLPKSPADATLYYTVWKDGSNVTTDPREGYLGQKTYVGRLPQLTAPYRLCGLSCHAISGPAALERADLYEREWIHGQPTAEAFRYVEDYDFQVMVWEDDVWYLELVLYPPSTDDAYKIITTTIANPTSRWQMMRHWNVINPGDHDYGMDDVKGPEQLMIRRYPDLGQDPEYMRRNFQIVQHLISGDEDPTALDNPQHWRAWKMPHRDFTLLILDSRLWRSSQDTNVWDDEGWGHKRNLYDRTDPTRTLLGEEQFAWLQEMVRTDTSPLICLTGINGLHTVWQGVNEDPETGQVFDQRDRVVADYAGWVKAGADRVLELISSREGIVTVYGDVHNGCLMKNPELGVYECSFGPIGRYGGRSVKEDFGPTMTDYDGRPVEVTALYHKEYQSPTLEPITGPKYWNFLEMHFDPRPADPELSMKIRNLIDPRDVAVRGGGHVEATASHTGRKHRSHLPALTTLPNADVRFITREGHPVRGIRSQPDGTVPVTGLVEVPPETPLLMVAANEETQEIQEVITNDV